MCVRLGIDPGQVLHELDRRVRVHISRAAREWAMLNLKAGGDQATWSKIASWPFGGFLRVESMENTWFKEPPRAEPAGDLTYPGAVLRVPIFEFTERDHPTGALVSIPARGLVEFHLRWRDSRFDDHGECNRWCLLTGPGVHNAVDRWGNVRSPVLSPAA